MASSSPASNKNYDFQWHYSELSDINFQIHGKTLIFILVVVSIILFIALFFIYVRWMCNKIYAPSSSPPPSQEFHHHQGLDVEALKNIPTALFGDLGRRCNNNNGDEECCSICLGVFGEEDQVKVLDNCNHCFHSMCVDQWFLYRTTCPLCRDHLVELILHVG